MQYTNFVYLNFNNFHCLFYSHRYREYVKLSDLIRFYCIFFIKKFVSLMQNKWNSFVWKLTVNKKKPFNNSIFFRPFIIKLLRMILINVLCKIETKTKRSIKNVQTQQPTHSNTIQTPFKKHCSVKRRMCSRTAKSTFIFTRSDSQHYQWAPVERRFLRWTDAARTSELTSTPIFRLDPIQKIHTDSRTFLKHSAVWIFSKFALELREKILWKLSRAVARHVRVFAFCCCEILRLILPTIFHIDWSLLKIIGIKKHSCWEFESTFRFDGVRFRQQVNRLSIVLHNRLLHVSVHVSKFNYEMCFFVYEWVFLWIVSVWHWNFTFRANCKCFRQLLCSTFCHKNKCEQSVYKKWPIDSLTFVNRM